MKLEQKRPCQFGLGTLMVMSVMIGTIGGLIGPTLCEWIIRESTTAPTPTLTAPAVRTTPLTSSTVMLPVRSKEDFVKTMPVRNKEDYEKIKLIRRTEFRRDHRIPEAAYMRLEDKPGMYFIACDECGFPRFVRHGTTERCRRCAGEEIDVNDYHPVFTGP